MKNKLRIIESENKNKYIAVFSGTTGSGVCEAEKTIYSNSGNLYTEFS